MAINFMRFFFIKRLKSHIPDTSRSEYCNQIVVVNIKFCCSELFAMVIQNRLLPTRSYWTNYIIYGTHIATKFHAFLSVKCDLKFQ